ncbi:MAG TPA: SDR family NAD(P)-dependent oxidoreductase [Stellaceae bacterium]|nr:SDR family NAD(P)-dependent oxidoreductase [Stellaceae bacterium]
MPNSPPRPLALVTGASSGIGAAFAERLAREGYDLILVARRRDRLEAAAARLSREFSAGVEVVAADLTDAAALAQIEARLADDERLGLLVNNAGFGGYRPFVEIDPKVADDLVAVHVRAATRLARAALPGMMGRGRGGIINIASLLALSGAMPPNPLPYRAVYAGAKAFLLAFTEALAGEVVHAGVRVQACLPGLVATEYHAVAGRDPSKMPPMMSAADVVAASLAALASGEVVCVPGLEDVSLLDRLSELRRAILLAANTPVLAPRYRAR